MGQQSIHWCTEVQNCAQGCTSVNSSLQVCTVVYKFLQWNIGDQIGRNSGLTTDRQTDRSGTSALIELRLRS